MSGIILSDYSTLNPFVVSPSTGSGQAWAECRGTTVSADLPAPTCRPRTMNGAAAARVQRSQTIYLNIPEAGACLISPSLQTSAPEQAGAYKTQPKRGKSVRPGHYRQCPRKLKY